jgi:hypothetical protein
VKEEDPLVYDCSAAHRERGGRGGTVPAVLTFLLVAVLPTYFPSREPYIRILPLFERASLSVSSTLRRFSRRAFPVKIYRGEVVFPQPDDIDPRGVDAIGSAL